MELTAHSETVPAENHSLNMRAMCWASGNGILAIWADAASSGTDISTRFTPYRTPGARPSLDEVLFGTGNLNLFS
jgi:hypothetical protein